MVITQAILALLGVFLLFKGFVESRLPDGAVIEHSVYLFLYTFAAVLVLIALLLPLIRKGCKKYLLVRVLSFLLAAILVLPFAMYGFLSLAPCFMPEADGSEAVLLVMGAPVIDDEPSVLLRSRAAYATAWIEAQPSMPVLISGGKGGEKTEAETIAALMMEAGVDAERLTLENRATSTAENFRYAAELLGGEGEAAEQSIAVLSNRFHIYRLGYNAKLAGFGAVRYVSVPTPLSVGLLWYTREAMSVMRYWLTGIL